MTDKDTIELKACPFCGGEFKLHQDTVDRVGALASDGGWYIGHGAENAKGCRVRICGYFKTAEEAIKYCNTRAPRQDPQVDVERLVDGLFVNSTEQQRNHNKPYWVDCIHYLASQGHLNTSTVQSVDVEALEALDKMYLGEHTVNDYNFLISKLKGK